MKAGALPMLDERVVAALLAKGDTRPEFDLSKPLWTKGEREILADLKNGTNIADLATMVYEDYGD